MNNQWVIEFKPKAFKELKKLDKKSQSKIFNYLDFLIEDCVSPRVVGEPLKGGYKGIRRYRVGNYRILCKLQDKKLIILVVSIGHRKNIY